MTTRENHKHHTTQERPGEGFPIEAKIAVSAVVLCVLAFLLLSLDFF